MRRARVCFAAVAGLVALSGCGGRGEQATSRSTTTVGSAPSTSGSTSSVPGLTPAPTTTGATTGPRPTPVKDFSVAYPDGWGPAGTVLATAFANGATCGSASIVDRAVPSDSGPGPSIEQSLVQVCWRGLDGKTLPAFVADTYGAVGGFQATTIAGRPAVVSRAGTSSTFFVDTSARRYQVASSVSASDALQPMRLAEVERILMSLSLPD